MKKPIIILKILLILSLVSILILWPILLLVSNSNIWFIIQKENNVVLPEEEIKIYNHQTVSFFKGESKNLDFLTLQEISHIQDVKNLVTRANLLFFISLILFLPTFLYLRKAQFIKFILRKTSLSVLLSLILLLVINTVGFNSFFLKFHEMFFVGNYFFPSNSMLKILYPDSFFRDIFIIYFLLSIIGCLTVWLASYRLKV